MNPTAFFCRLVSVLFLLLGGSVVGTVLADDQCYEECEHGILEGYTEFINERCCDFTSGEMVEDACVDIMLLPEYQGHDLESCFETIREWMDDADCTCDEETKAEEGLMAEITQARFKMWQPECDFENNTCNKVVVAGPGPGGIFFAQSWACVTCPPGG